MNNSQLAFFLLGKKYGYDFKQLFDFAMDIQYWDEERIYNYQLSKLQSLIHHVYKEEIPFYTRVMRNLGMEPGDVKELSVTNS